jgi:hypothetical protein
VKVSNASVVVVLSGEEGPREVEWMSIGEWVVVSIPATEAEVKPTNTSVMVVDKNNFLMMRPELHII